MHHMPIARRHNDPPAHTPAYSTSRPTLRLLCLAHIHAQGVCKSGNYTCATIEHFAAFAPAFGRRPYIREQNLSLVVRTDYSLAGTVLNISTVIGGASLHGSIVGTENGYSRLTFPLSLLPPVASGNFSETVLINLTLPDGRTRGKPRRFMRAVPPASGMPTSTVQVDHESGGLLMDGVRKTCNGWFNNPNGGIAGLPVSDTCDIARTNDLQNQAYRAARNQAAQVRRPGHRGLCIGDRSSKFALYPSVLRGLAFLKLIIYVF